MPSKHALVADIEKTLEEIWQSFQGTNKMRASLFNLVIFTEKNKRSLYLDKIAHKVIEKFPSRIIFIQIDDENKENKIQTTVSLINAGKDNSDIVCDLIDILAPKKLAEKVPFIVLSHLLPDLPIYFLYGSNIDTKETIFSQIEPLSEKVIVDSEAALKITSFAKITLDYHKKQKAKIADLNWERIHSFRTLFATIFKSQEDLAHLKTTEEIHLKYNNAKNTYFEHHHIQASYFQAWISVCLGWTITSIKGKNGIFTFDYKSSKGSPRITLSPCKMENVLPGRICSVHLKTAKADFKIDRNPKSPHCLIIEKSLKTECFLPSLYMIDKETSGQSLINELAHAGVNEHYIKTLKQIITFLPWENVL
ncbi:hypothetical protein COB21_06280 [Candidatus Aerophobetes bacterium]|uniref:Glucose-6-phosphate dehydrogenase n=1 Tax=Aerophobetes bacterium TaxID=2030807 RepID=A0A2A4WYI0_UNCAE|nr:MAG: hypothetical protein COB21_06280 [Candidatus Aerophobetes bacterium]